MHIFGVIGGAYGHLRCYWRHCNGFFGLVSHIGHTCGKFYIYAPPGSRRGAAGEPPRAYMGPYMQIYGILRLTIVIANP